MRSNVARQLAHLVGARVVIGSSKFPAAIRSAAVSSRRIRRANSQAPRSRPPSAPTSASAPASSSRFAHQVRRWPASPAAAPRPAAPTECRAPGSPPRRTGRPRRHRPADALEASGPPSSAIGSCSTSVEPMPRESRRPRAPSAARRVVDDHAGVCALGRGSRGSRASGNGRWATPGRAPAPPARAARRGS